jgi:hypothetical protein
MIDAGSDQQLLITFALAGHFDEHGGEFPPRNFRINRGAAGVVIAVPGAIESPGKQLFDFDIGDHLGFPGVKHVLATQKTAKQKSMSPARPG